MSTITRANIAIAAAGSVVTAFFIAPPAAATSDEVELGDTAAIAEIADDALAAIGATEEERPDVNASLDVATEDLNWENVTLDPDEGSVAYETLSLEITIPLDAPSISASESVAVANGDDSGIAFAVVPTDEASARILAIAEQSHSADPVHRYAYELSVEEGTEIRQLDDGDVVMTAVVPEHQASPEEIEAGLEENEVIVGGFVAPWAVDADGAALPTSFELDGTTLVQHVDTRGAVFPVVSDPLPLIVIPLVASVVARVGVSAAVRAFAVYAPRIGMTVTSRTGYSSFARVKSAIGNLKPNHDWHHIVVQANVTKKRFSASMVHNTKNLIQVPRNVHRQCLTKIQNSNRSGTFLRVKFSSGGGNVSNQVQKLSYRAQYDFGVRLLQHCGVKL